MPLQVYAVALIILYSLAYLLVWLLLKKKEDDDVGMLFLVAQTGPPVYVRCVCSCC